MKIVLILLGILVFLYIEYEVVRQNRTEDFRSR